jgi:metallo-beta-lactamase family protein
MSIKLHFHGAARAVTGSCYLIETANAKVLVDCGMFQGSKTEKELNYRAFPFRPASLDAMLLTHAHIDHTGLIPKLVKDGFAGRIHATEATIDLCRIMLPDSGFIQESEVRLLNERNRKRGLPEVEPIYTAEDAKLAISSMVGTKRGAWIAPARGIRARYWNAGHLLGSASIELEVEQQGGSPLRILFSGDIGPDQKLLENDPEAPRGFDYVICESTYGGHDRFERTEAKRRELLATEISAAAARGGALLIPSFAVERTQEVITDLISLMTSGAVPKGAIFIDSPLALRATEIFKRHAGEIPNGDELRRAFESPLIHNTESVEESKAIARFRGFHVIVAASGMCEAGRIRHHLKNHLWRADATVLLVGYQAEGSLGRLLQDGEKTVIIHGDEVQVQATIRVFEDYSGHADGPELVQWLAERLPIRRAVFLTHGEEERQVAITNDIADKVVGADQIIRPRIDDVFELTGAAPRHLAEESRPRINPEMMARLDWHNDLTRLVLDINSAVSAAADENRRQVIIRALRRALDQQTEDDGRARRR